MDHEPRAFIAALIGSIVTRTDDETHDALDHLDRRLWPGGSADRSDRPALAWLRLWQPKRAGPVVLHCVCDRGPCGLCN